MTLKRIIISRTDSIGDVVLTLPMAGILKENDPDCKILFLGTTYTMPVVKLSKYVDEFINWDILQNETNPEEALKKLKADVIIHVYPNKDIASLAFKAKIPIRIGTFGRLFHVLTCNKKVRFSRPYFFLYLMYPEKELVRIELKYRIFDFLKYRINRRTK